MEFICYINLFFRYGRELLERMLKDVDIAMNELIVILVIRELPGVGQSKLNRFVGMDKGNFSNYLTKMENKNLIYRKRGKRGNGCYLTDSGKALIPKLEKTLEAWNALCLEGIEDQEEFVKGSETVAMNLSRALDIRW